MKKFNDIFCKVLSEIVILLVAGSVFVTALNVFMRFVLNSPFFWVEQVFLMQLSSAEYWAYCCLNCWANCWNA